MKYMLLMHHGQVPGVPPMSEWTPDEMRAHGLAMMAIHEELAERGELVGTAGLAGPDSARIVTDDGSGAPVVTDGPFPETKEFLAGYWLVDVDSEERALEIAARTSAAPGPGGRAVGKPIEVRPVMHAPPDPEL